MGNVLKIDTPNVFVYDRFRTHIFLLCKLVIQVLC